MSSNFAAPSRRRLLAAATAGLCCAAMGGARRAGAQPIGRLTRVVVGFPPGGAPDVVARVVADALRGPYAQTVVVENKSGAGGRIAVEAVKVAEPDGSTMLVTPNPIITIYPHVYRNLSYDPLRDFTPVTSLCSYPLVLSAGPALPADVNSLAELVGWCKAHPANASFGTPAAGSTLHFVGVVFASAAGIKLQHIAYRGGRIPLAVTPPAPVVPLIRAGRLRALATTSVDRSPLLPDVPTFKEAGYSQLAVRDWIGLFVPAKTPSDRVEQLNALLRRALTSREVGDTYATLMMDVSSESPREAARMVQAEYEMWRPIVKASGFSVID